jgi:hypothetical protein
MLAWLKHFDAYIKASSTRAYRLLIINSYKSYYLIEF